MSVKHLNQISLTWTPNNGTQLVNRLYYAACRCGIFVDCVWNVMAHAPKTRFRLSAKRTIPFKSVGGGISSVDYWQPEVCASAVVMLDTPCSEVVWRVLSTHSIRQFPLYLPSRTSPCAITSQLEFTYSLRTSRHYTRLFAGKIWYNCDKKMKNWITKWVPGIFFGKNKRPIAGLTTHSYLAPGLKKEHNHTTTLFMGIHAVF